MSAAASRRPVRSRRLMNCFCGLLCASSTLFAIGQTVPQGDSPNKLADPAALRHDRTEKFLSGRISGSRGSAAQALNRARLQHLAMRADPRQAILNAAWTAVGPQQIASQQYGNITGRITAVAIDPADPSGNTVYVGTTGAGVWKSTNAAGPATAVTFVPLTDTLPVFSPATLAIPSLSIGAVAAANGILLAGTGDPNDATDSYYGSGILRSPDGGATWTLAQQSLDGAAGNHLLFGLSTAGFAFSSANPSLVVAAMSQAAEGVLVNAKNASGSVMGLYWSSDAGLTWHMATIMDGSQIVQAPLPPGSSNQGNAATSVVWNPVRQSFYAAVQYHGYYKSSDGMTWTRLANQPGPGLTTAACPTNPATSGNPSCPIFRGVLAVEPVTGDTFALTVDAANHAQGLYQDVCALQRTVCGNASLTFGTALNATPLEVGSGSTVIAQADYNLSLAAVSSGTDTLLYAGTVDLYRCSIAAGCILRNTTNAQDGCTNPAMVAPAQHAIATLSNAGTPLVYLGNDGGLWRSTDGVSESGPVCSATDASHFQNLNAGIGSLAEVVSFAQDPTSTTTFLAGLGALGTAGTSTVTNAWAQLAAGEGGTVAIDPANPSLWYISNGAGISIARCVRGFNCTAADFTAAAIGAAQVANDVAAVHAPWLLDPGLTSNLIAGTCRVWRGPATGGALWSSSNEVSPPLGAQSATACGSTSPVVRSLAVGGPGSTSANSQNAGSNVIYAGMAGVLDGGQGVGGHLFVTTAANIASHSTHWADLAASPVTNDLADAGLFNPGGFDISSVAADPHDTTGATVYATVMGFNVPHVYRSIDAGTHWTNISSNLPNAPANSVIVDPNDANTLYVALDTGVYVTTQVTSCTFTNCWSVYGISLPNSPVVELQSAASMPTGDGRTGELRAATYGRGIWQIPLLTAISVAAPRMAISPLTVTYPSEPVGSASPYQTFTVTNTGNAPLTVSSIAVSGDFNETDNCAGTSIPQNATCAVQVRFLPSVTGTRSGLLTVYGNVSGGQATATLSGIGLGAPAIVLTPVTLMFPATNVGVTSGIQNITVSNLGVSTANLQMVAISGDFKFSGNTCGTSLGPSTGCTLSIVFSPSAAGARSGSVTVVDDAGTQVASLSGTGTNPAKDILSPLMLVFAAQQLSTVSPAQQVTLTNSGDLALTLIAAQVTSGDFNVVNGCGNSLSAHSTCSLTVTYSPRSLGLQTGSMTVSDQYQTQTVQLSGTGLAPPGVSLSPTNGLAFGAIALGASSAAQSVTLTNNGGVPLTIAGVTASGDYALPAGSNTCGGSLAPAGACIVMVVFSPTVAGGRSGTVTFSDNAASGSQSLQLSGTGIDFSLASNGPASITVTNGQNATYALLLTSVAGLPGSVAFTCMGAPTHSLCTVNPASSALGGTTTVTVTVATGLLMASTQPIPLPWSKRLVWLAALLPLGLAARRRCWRLPMLMALLLTVSACGSARTLPLGSDSSGITGGVTPSGTYNLVVAGSSVGLVRSVHLTLVVQ